MQEPEYSDDFEATYSMDNFEEAEPDSAEGSQVNVDSGPDDTKRSLPSRFGAENATAALTATPPEHVTSGSQRKEEVIPTPIMANQVPGQQVPAFKPAVPRLAGTPPTSNPKTPESVSAMSQMTGAKLTFTSPPYVPRAKPQERANFSHSKNQVTEISRENEILVNKLTQIGQRKNSASKPNAPPASVANKSLPCNTPSSAINRKKAGDAITQANLALYKRLQAIKPSKETSRDALAKSHQQQITYSKNCSNFKAPPLSTFES